MKKKRKKKYTAEILLDCLAVGFFLLTCFYVQRKVKQIPDSILFIPSEEIFLEKETQPPAEKSQIQAGISRCTETEYGNALVVDKIYQKLSGYEIQKGRKIDFSDEVPQALLTKEQSRTLGKEAGDLLEIGEKNYEIVGVLKKNTVWESVLHTEAEDMILSQAPDKGKLPVSGILFWSKNETFLYVKDTSFALNNLYNQVFDGSFHHIGLMKKTVKGISFLLFFLLAFPIFAAGIVWAGKQIFAAYRRWKESVWKGLFLLGRGALTIGIVCVIWCWVFGNMLPPQPYLPQEQIFDIKHYVSEIMRFYRNLLGICKTCVPMQRLGGLAVGQVAVSVVSVACFWGAYGKWKLDRKRK